MKKRTEWIRNDRQRDITDNPAYEASRIESVGAGCQLDVFVVGGFADDDNATAPRRGGSGSSSVVTKLRELCRLYNVRTVLTRGKTCRSFAFDPRQAARPPATSGALCVRLFPVLYDRIFFNCPT